MSGAVTATLVAVGVDAATAAAVAGTAVTAAEVGGGLGLLTGTVSGLAQGEPLGKSLLGGVEQGAIGGLTGGLTGGVGGLAGGALGDALGVSSGVGGALAGGATGAALGAGLGSLTGTNPITGALEGGVGGALAGYSGGDATAGDSTSSAPASATNSASLPAGATGTVGASGTTGTMGAMSATPATGSPNLSSSLISTPAASTTSGFVGPSAPSLGVDYTSVASEGAGTTAPVTSNSPGVLSQISNYLFGGGSSSTPTTGANAISNLSEAQAAYNATGQTQILTNAAGTPIGSIGDNGLTMLNSSGTSAAAGATGAGANSAGSGSQGILSKLGNNIINNPLQAGLVGLNLYNSATAPKLPTAAQQQASTQGASFSASLPQYQFNSTRNPISNYYTYGYSPQPMQITNTLTPVTSNTTTTLKQGGKVKKMAHGSLVPRIHTGTPVGVPRPTAGIKRPSGAGLASLGAISKMRDPGAASAAPVSLGALSGGGRPKMAPAFMNKGRVAPTTNAGGQADNVPAMLSENEYVMPADVTSHLGDGSSDAGGKILDKFVANVRAHKTSKGAKGLPPKAKSPEQYLPKET